MACSCLLSLSLFVDEYQKLSFLLLIVGTSRREEENKAALPPILVPVSVSVPLSLCLSVCPLHSTTHHTILDLLVLPPANVSSPSPPSGDRKR